MFSTLDLLRGYWQIGLAEESREKTAFTTPNGLYQFKVMPFGLSNAPGSFQRLMQHVPRHLLNKICLLYMDVIVISRNVEQHQQHLQLVFDAIRKAKLKLKLSKCCFASNEVEFLGHRISAHGVGPIERNASAVKTYLSPRNVHSVKSFLGLCSYYRRFIKDFARIA